MYHLFGGPVIKKYLICKLCNLSSLFLKNSNKNSVRKGQKLVSKAFFSLLIGNLTSNSANNSVGRERHLNDAFAQKCVVY